MIKQLLNSVIAKYRDLLVSRRSIIIDLLATDKSRYFAQPRAIIVHYLRRTAGMSSCISRLKVLSLNTSQLDQNGD